MYEDKLDGRVDQDFFDRKAGEWRAEQARLREQIMAHEEADQGYLELGAQLLEIAHNARSIFLPRSGSTKGQFLRILLSNCSWMNGELQVEFRQAFALLEDTSRQVRELGLEATGTDGLHPTWLATGCQGQV